MKHLATLFALLTAAILTRGEPPAPPAATARSVTVDTNGLVRVPANLWEANLGRISVKEPRFGAKGDGETDDTAAFKSAAAAMTSGSTLVIPAGSYLIANATQPAIGLTNLSNVTIQMAGEMIHKDYTYADSSTWKTITGLSWSGGVATVDTSGPHGFSPGDSVTIAAASDGYLGKRTVLATPDSDTFTFSLASDPGADTDSGYVAKESFNRYFVSLSGCTNVNIVLKLRNNTPLPVYNQMDVGYVGVYAVDCVNVHGRVDATGLAYAVTVIPSSVPNWSTVYPPRDYTLDIVANQCGYGLNGQWMENARINLNGKVLHRGAYLASPRNFVIDADLTDYETAGVTLVCPSVGGLTTAQSMENVTVNARVNNYTFDEVRYPSSTAGPPLINYSRLTGSGAGTNVYFKNITLNAQVVADANTPCGLIPVFLDCTANKYWINGLKINVQHDRSQQPTSTDFNQYTCYLNVPIANARGISIDYRGTSVGFTATRGLYVNIAGMQDNLQLFHTDQNKESITTDTEVHRFNPFVQNAVSTVPVTGSGKAAVYPATDSDTITRIALKNSDGTTNSFQTMGVSTMNVGIANLTNFTIGFGAGGQVLWHDGTRWTNSAANAFQATNSYLATIAGAGAVDWGGFTSFEIPNSDDPDVSAAGQLSWDTDGWLRAYDGSAQVAVGRKIESIDATIVKPNDLADATRDALWIWKNVSGMSFIVTGWDAVSDTDDTTLNIEEIDADGQNNTTVDAVEIATNGTGLFYGSDTTITAATIETGHILVLDFDDTDTPGQVKITIYGYYDANVN